MRPRDFALPDLRDERGYAHPALAAIKALSAGQAREDQQKTALDFIINALCGTHELSYRSGDGGERDTAFLEGRRSIGLTIARIITQPTDVLVPPQRVDA